MGYDHAPTPTGVLAWFTEEVAKAEERIERRLRDRRQKRRAQADRRANVCRCWNEGQWGRVHREDCAIHGDAK